MIKFEAEFECKTEQEVIYALQHIIDRIECGYVCGYLTDVTAEGDWGMSGEEEEEIRTLRVRWDVPDNQYETFMDDGVPRVVEVPVSVGDDEIEDYLYREYGYGIESYEEI